MKLDKVRTLFEVYFSQFTIYNAIRLLCAEFSQKLFDFHSISSYSQIGEDRIIAAFLDTTLGRNGFYVDVGCNHPQHYSNTFALYKKGWSGITIDANQELIQKHQRLRRRDLSICAVVSNKEKEVTFTEFENSLVSSLNDEHISVWEKWTDIKARRVVKAVTLNTILDTYEAPKDFDLLCIDVEGHDFEVLSSLNLDVYRPRLIVIEMHGFDLLKPDSNQIYEYLRFNNYKLIGYAVMNGYFIDISQRSTYSSLK